VEDQLSPDQLRELAREGARARIGQLTSELGRLKLAFPELFEAMDPGSAAGGRTSKRNLTEEQRQSISERMTRYWAARRKEREKAGGRKPRRR
jgi:hypothetical protein